MKIVIEGELPDLNTEINNAKKHWSFYSKQKEFYTYTVKMSILRQKIPKITTQIKPSFHWYTRNLKKDADNISFAKKYILDGMVAAKILPNDDRKVVVGFGGEEFSVDRDHPRVEIEY